MHAPQLLMLYGDEEAEGPAPTAAPPKMPDRPTNLLHHLDDFTPLGSLGRGNMGTVFLVLSHSTPFALKITHSLPSKKQRSHIEREILSSLHHPFLQTLHAHFEFGNHSLFLLDFCSGGDLNLLRHRQPEKRFSETAARFYAAEVLMALEHLHKLGIVYRDLKPENILVQGNGHLKLTDFDLSLNLGAGEPAASMRAPETARSAAVATLQQHMVADADLGKVQQGPHARRHAAAATVCSKPMQCTAMEPEGLKLSVVGEAETVRARGAKQTCTLRSLQCLGFNGNQSIRRRKKGTVMKRETLHVGEKEGTKLGRKVKRAKKLRTHNSCFPQSKVSKDCQNAEESRYVCVVGTDEYVAPEVLRGEEQGFSMDWWSFGVFLYEMIYGQTPFKGVGSEGTLRNILGKEPEFPGMKTPAKDLIAWLLVKDPSRRLGTLGGAQAIKRHPFFSGLNWDSLPYICRPPFIPRPLCLAELEERYADKLKSKGQGTATHNIEGEQQLGTTCKFWLDEIVENIEAKDKLLYEHTSSQHSPSSSAGFPSSSVDGANGELRRGDEVDARFSSADWSSELELAGKTLMRS